MTELERCLSVYQSLTQLQVKPLIWESALTDFLAHGYTPDDLGLVVSHLLRENKRMKGAKFSLRLNTLLDWQYERFDSFLAEARAVQRNRPRLDAKDVVLSQWRGVPPTRTGAEAVKVSEVLRKLKQSL